MAELLWSSKELTFVIRESRAAGNLLLKQAERAYEVCNLEEPVFARLDGLREFNRTWQRRRSDTAKKVGDSLLSAVVIDLYTSAGCKHTSVTNSKVGKLAFK